mmetsp:Transcript_22673/g.38844  ORF Transcript_22673/g.38844 Transcript_22673/m.38844 type:complete len:210 (-) Transcript_22673:270-899(-)
MDGPQKVGDAFGRLEIGTVLETDGEAVKFGEGGGPTGDVTGADGGDEGGIESAGEEDAPGDVGHHAAGDGFFEGVAKDILLKLVLRRLQPRLHLRCPIRLIPPHELPRLRSLIGITMPRWEILKFRTFSHKALHFATHIHAPIIAPSDIQRRFANVISEYKVRVARFIVHDDGKHTAEFVGQFCRRAEFVPEGEHDFAIGSGGGFVGIF